MAARRALSSHCQLFLAHGARLDLDNYSAIRFTVSTPEMIELGVFLSGNPGQSSLSAASEEAATLTTNYRLEPMQRLLRAGLRGQIVDEYVVALANNGSNHALLQLLLEYGADPSFDAGAALCSACAHREYALIGTLSRFNPSVRCRSRALHCLVRSDPAKSSAERFCEVVDMLVIRQSATPTRFAANVKSFEAKGSLSKLSSSAEPSIRTLLKHWARQTSAVKKAFEAG